MHKTADNCNGRSCITGFVLYPGSAEATGPEQKSEPEVRTLSARLNRWPPPAHACQPVCVVQATSDYQWSVCWRFPVTGLRSQPDRRTLESLTSYELTTWCTLQSARLATVDSPSSVAKAWLTSPLLVATLHRCHCGLWNCGRISPIPVDVIQPHSALSQPVTLVRPSPDVAREIT